MARCREVLTSSVTGEVILVCDLDEHDKILNFHYDQLNQSDWRQHNDPTPVPSTRLSPSRKPSSSVHAFTGAFDTVRSK